MTLQPRATPPVARALFVLMTILTMATVAAQSNDIAFEYEILRVDLIRGDDGQPVERLTPTDAAFPGDILEYRVITRNAGEVFYRPGRVVVQVPIGVGSTYVPGTATTNPLTLVSELSIDGGASFVTIPAEGEEASEAYAAMDLANATHLRWTFTMMFEPDQEETLSYRVEIQ